MVQEYLPRDPQTVRWFRYTTQLSGAAFALELALDRVQLSFTVPAPYLLSVRATWDRVCAGGADLTRLLTATDAVLRATLDADLAWRLGVIATEEQGVLTAAAPLSLDQLTVEQVRAIYTRLPQGTASRTWRRYDRRTRQERQYLAVADACE